MQIRNILTVFQFDQSFNKINISDNNNNKKKTFSLFLSIFKNPKER